jgi:hypothetical protein
MATYQIDSRQCHDCDKLFRVLLCDVEEQTMGLSHTRALSTFKVIAQNKCVYLLYVLRRVGGSIRGHQEQPRRLLSSMIGQLD